MRHQSCVPLTPCDDFFCNVFGPLISILFPFHAVWAVRHVPCPPPPLRDRAAARWPRPIRDGTSRSVPTEQRHSMAGQTTEKTAWRARSVRWLFLRVRVESQQGTWNSSPVYIDSSFSKGFPFPKKNQFIFPWKNSVSKVALKVKSSLIYANK